MKEIAMWGEDWLTMIWGGIPLPMMGPLGWTLLVGALAGAAVVLYPRPLSKTKTSVVLLVIAIVPLVAIAQVTLPHTFSNGTVADADEVNANFDAVVTELDTQDARLTNKLWTRVAEVDVQYVSIFQIAGLNGDAAQMYRILFKGTLQSNGIDSHILIQPNGVSSLEYLSIACYYGSVSPDCETVTGGFSLGRNGWHSDNKFVIEYTIVANQDSNRLGYGESVFYDYSGERLLAFDKLSGVWNPDLLWNITSLWIRTSHSSAKMSGKLILFALK
jgi:hypothetical protein